MPGTGSTHTTYRSMNRTRVCGRKAGVWALMNKMLHKSASTGLLLHTVYMGTGSEKYLHGGGARGVLQHDLPPRCVRRVQLELQLVICGRDDLHPLRMVRRVAACK